MTTDQNNILTMFETTLAFLDDNNSVWSGRPAFADAVMRAKAAVEAIDSSVDQQETPITGKTGDKAEARTALEEKALEVADAISAYATKSGNHDLAAQVEMTKSSLDRMPENELEQIVERLEGLATTNMAALADFEVTAADVTELTDLRTAFSSIKTAPREAVAARSAQTLSIPARIAAARSIFRNEIDKLMTKFKKTNPDFYNGYFAARVIVDRAATQSRSTPAAPSTPTP